MQNNSNIDILSNMFDQLENNFEKFVIEELERIGGPLWSQELSEELFNFEGDTYFSMLYLDTAGDPVVESIGEHEEHTYLTDVIGNNHLPHCNMIKLLQELQRTKPRKIYHLKGQQGNPDIKCTIHDLVPLHTKNKPSFGVLSRFLDSNMYLPDLEQPMEDEFNILYSQAEHSDVSFFQLVGTDLIVAPGKYLYTTILSPDDPMFKR